MIILGYTRTYQGGLAFARSKGYDFAYVVCSNQAPIWTPRFYVVVQP